jgi:ParB family chromosome partitioning protein
MRKNLLANITGAAPAAVAADSRSEYTRRGASRSMMISIDELAENAKRMSAGETVVELDPTQIDVSFVQDRLGDDPESFDELKQAIRTQGQSTPILVRPHPTTTGRFMTVFGHRRLRVARELGIPVRAVIKDVESIAHVIMQGQENSARANLTFVERAMFARKLQEAGQDKDVIKAALSVDDSLLSRMLSVVEVIPEAIIEVLGPSKRVGRDRWESLKKMLLKPQVRERALEVIQTTSFMAKSHDVRFEHLMSTLRAASKRPPRQSNLPSRWQPADSLVTAEIRRTARTVNLTFEAPNARAFGDFVSASLDELYRAFKAQQGQQTPGD